MRLFTVDLASQGFWRPLHELGQLVHAMLSIAGEVRHTGLAGGPQVSKIFRNSLAASRSHGNRRPAYLKAPFDSKVSRLCMERSRRRLPKLCTLRLRWRKCGFQRVHKSHHCHGSK